MLLSYHSLLLVAFYDTQKYVCSMPLARTSRTSVLLFAFFDTQDTHVWPILVARTSKAMTSDQRLTGIRLAAGISPFAPLLECLVTPIWVRPTRVRGVVTPQVFQQRLGR